MVEMTTSPAISCMHDCYVTPVWYSLTQLAALVSLALITRRWRFVPASAALGVLVISIVMPLTVYGLPDEFGFGAPRLLTGWSALAHYAFALVVVAIVFGIKRSIVLVANGQGWLLLNAYGAGVAVVAAGLAAVAGLYAFAPAFLPAFGPRPVNFELQAMCKAGSAAPVSGLPSFRGNVQRAAGVRAVGPLSAAQMVLPAVHTTEMRFEHQLGFPERIRIPDPGRYGADAKVALTLAVNERGDVIAATPFGGPRELFGPAVAIASSWKFVPFARNGRPVSVRVLRAAVEVAGPENRWLLPLQYPDYGDLRAVNIRLASSRYDHAFALEIRGDGTVAFQGAGSRIGIHGIHCAQIDRAAVAALLEEFRRADFFSLQSGYFDSRDGDVSIAIGDFQHDVTVHVSGDNHTPEAYWRLVHRFSMPFTRNDGSKATGSRLRVWPPNAGTSKEQAKRTSSCLRALREPAV